MSAQPEAPYLEAQVEDRLSALIEHTGAEIEQLKRTRVAVEKKIRLLARRRQLYEATLHALSPHSDEHTGEWALRLVPDQLPTKPRAVLAFLSEHPDQDFRLIEIRHALIARGWMGDDKQSAHALEVAVRMLQTRGEIERPRRGVYRIRRHEA
jgi:hypothetical protein